MRRFILQLVVMLGALAGSGPSLGATIHLIVAADTNQLDIGDGIKANEVNLEQYFQYVESTLGLNHVVPVTVDGNEFANGNTGCAKVKTALANLTISPDDVVVFYYAGHGFQRPSSTSQFPDFNCAGMGPPYFGLQDAETTLAGKGAHLVVAIADTCNVKALVPSREKPAPAKAGGYDLKTALRRLFIESQGSVMIAASKPGKPAWYIDTGGFFTGRLILSLEHEQPQEGLAQWKHVMIEATTAIKVRDSRGRITDIQHPIMDLSHLIEPAPSGPGT